MSSQYNQNSVSHGSMLNSHPTSNATGQWPSGVGQAQGATNPNTSMDSDHVCMGGGVIVVVGTEDTADYVSGI